MSAKRNHPVRMPIWRDANRLLLEVETAVRDFPRYHKYTLGSELRRQAMRICQLLSRALTANGSQREQGYLHGGLKRRVLAKVFINGRLDCAVSAKNQQNQRKISCFTS